MIANLRCNTNIGRELCGNKETNFLQRNSILQLKKENYYNTKTREITPISNISTEGAASRMAIVHRMSK
jgi:hypothetical protein